MITPEFQRAKASHVGGCCWCSSRHVEVIHLRCDGPGPQLSARLCDNCATLVAGLINRKNVRIAPKPTLIEDQCGIEAFIRNHTPTSAKDVVKAHPHATILGDALVKFLTADQKLELSKAGTPSYTGDRSDADYVCIEQQEYNDAADLLRIAIIKLFQA